MTAPHTVVHFTRYPLAPGQKIRIDDGPRRGDWLVVDVDERTMHLRCPVSGKEVHWDRFFTVAEVRAQDQWPERD